MTTTGKRQSLILPCFQNYSLLSNILFLAHLRIPRSLPAERVFRSRQGPRVRNVSPLKQLLWSYRQLWAVISGLQAMQTVDLCIYCKRNHADEERPSESTKIHSRASGHHEKCVWARYAERLCKTHSSPHKKCTHPGTGILVNFFGIWVWTAVTDCASEKTVKKNIPLTTSISFNPCLVRLTVYLFL